IGAESQDALDRVILLKKPKGDETGGAGIDDGEFDDRNGLGDIINAGFNSLRRPARRLENDRGEVAKKPLLGKSALGGASSDASDPPEYVDVSPERSGGSDDSWGDDAMAIAPKKPDHKVGATLAEMAVAHLLAKGSMSLLEGHLAEMEAPPPQVLRRRLQVEGGDAEAPAAGAGAPPAAALAPSGEWKCVSLEGLGELVYDATRGRLNANCKHKGHCKPKCANCHVDRATRVEGRKPRKGE
ncbi:unnamed protein product, partial [Prorocentrum cordatum]